MSNLLLNQFYTRIEISLQSDTFIAITVFEEDMHAINTEFEVKFT